MDSDTKDMLKDWFNHYVGGFRFEDPEDQRNIDLKIGHTERVCEEVLDIGKSLNLDADSLNLAEAMALLHDIGRFEQYARYRTFVDLKSEDHALLGVEVLRGRRVIEGLDPSVKDLVLKTVSYHNRVSLPEEESDQCLFFSRLLRDADKLDILRVVTDYYRKKGGEKNSALELDLPDDPMISDAAYSDLVAGRIVRTECLRTFNDFKLLQMSWVYDINFRLTFQRIKERHYLETIRDALPDTDKVKQVYEQVKGYLLSRVNAKGD